MSYYCEIGERKWVLIYYFIGFCFGSIYFFVYMYEMDFCFKFGCQFCQICYCFFIFWFEVCGIGDMINGVYWCILWYSDYWVGCIYEGMGGNVVYYLLYGVVFFFVFIIIS